MCKMFKVFGTFSLCFFALAAFAKEKEYVFTPERALVEFKKASLDAFVKAPTKPLLIKFFMPSCPPCRATKPVVAAVAKEFDGKVIVLEVDVTSTSEQRKLATDFDVYSVPTFVYIDAKGKKLGQHTGGDVTEMTFRADFKKYFNL